MMHVCVYKTNPLRKIHSMKRAWCTMVQKAAESFYRGGGEAGRKMVSKPHESV